VEVVHWGWEAHAGFLEAWGAEVAPRTGGDGAFVQSDNGQLLLDCRFPHGIEDPCALEAALATRAGIVETGLFLGLASEALIATANGITRMERPR
jgi:ribose 5-phosphate isomerase A